jgi:hypothetical protein
VVADNACEKLVFQLAGRTAMSEEVRRVEVIPYQVKGHPLPGAGSTNVGFGPGGRQPREEAIQPNPRTPVARNTTPRAANYRVAGRAKMCYPNVGHRHGG